jgi:LysR family transcriptional regulator, carnitine catabolism transcriptional activator
MNLEAPDLSVKHLRAIVALARFGSFIAAASFLGISQPGLSRVIQQAEGILKVTLFLRGTRNVSLSAAGRDFVPVAERMLIELAQQAKKLRELDGKMRGQLIIASLMSISHHVLAEALVDFRRRHPTMFVRVRDGLGDQVLEDVRSGVADFGIGNATGAPPDIAFDTIVEDRFYAVLPADHVLGDQPVLTFRTLAEAPLVSMPIESGLRRAIDLAANAQGVALDHSLITNQYASLFRFVASGLGATVVPATVVQPADDRAFAIRAIEPAVTRRIGVMRLVDRPLSEPAEMFLELFRPRLRSATRSTHAKSALNG